MPRCSGNIAEQCGTEHNINGDGLGQKETNTGMAGDGSKQCMEADGNGSKWCGNRWDGTEIPPILLTK